MKTILVGAAKALRWYTILFALVAAALILNAIQDWYASDGWAQVGRTFITTLSLMYALRFAKGLFDRRPFHYFFDTRPKPQMANAKFSDRD